MAFLSTRRLTKILARVFLIAFATAAVIWTIVVLPKFWSEAFIVQAATHIIDGEVYKPEAMEVLETELDHNRGTRLPPSILSKTAIIRLRVAENAIARGNQQIIDRSLNAVSEAVDETLTNAPSESFQWLVLFWLKDTRNGFKPEHLRYLQMSYALDPYAAWIAIKRNRLALAIYPALSPELAQVAVSEFLGLVRSQLYGEAADIVAGSTRPVRQILLTRLNDLKDPDRRPLDRMLYEKNITDIPA